MKKYEGKSVNIRINGVEDYVLDRSNFSNRKLYPGDSWKVAHYAIFGYYPKDWDDMVRITDLDTIACMEDEERYSNCKNAENLELIKRINLYNAVYETIKLITGKEIVLDNLVYSRLMNEYIDCYYYLTNLLSISLMGVEEAPNNYISIMYTHGDNYHLELNYYIELQSFVINTLIYYIYQDRKNEKNPVGATNYLDINSLVQVTDENQRFIFSAFLEVIQKIRKQSTKKDNSMWDKLQEIMKGEKVTLRDFENKGPTPLFTLENTKVRLVFSNHNSVGIHFK